MNIQVAIADDHPIVITGIRQMLESETDIVITKTFGSSRALLDDLHPPLPDVLLLDIHMPGKTGEEVMPILLERYPGLRVIALTGFDHIFYVRSMMQAGAMGYVLKTSSRTAIRDAIISVYENREYIDPELAPLLEKAKRNNGVVQDVKLTSRDREVLRLLAAGNSSQQISELLSLSLQTIKNYRLNLLTKLDVQNGAGLVRKAIELRLV